MATPTTRRIALLLKADGIALSDDQVEAINKVVDESEARETISLLVEIRDGIQSLEGLHDELTSMRTGIEALVRELGFRREAGGATRDLLLSKVGIPIVTALVTAVTTAITGAAVYFGWKHE